MIAWRKTGPRAPGMSRARGFSLIEVLVALLILAFGLLGLAFLQVLNVRYTQSAAQRTIATNLAYEVLDMMRANREAAAQYTKITVASFGSVAVPADGGCNRGDEGGIPAYDTNMTRWRCEVVDTLPGGTGSVVMNGNEVTVSLNWSDDVGREDGGDDGAPSKTTTFAVTTQL